MRTIAMLAALLAPLTSSADNRFVLGEIGAHRLLCVPRSEGDASAELERLVKVSNIILPYPLDDQSLICALTMNDGARDGFVVIERPAGAALLGICPVDGDAAPQDCAKQLAALRGAENQATLWTVGLLRSGEGNADDLTTEDLSQAAIGQRALFFHDESRTLDLVQFALLLVSPVSSDEVAGVRERLAQHDTMRGPATEDVPVTQPAN